MNRRPVTHRIPPPTEEWYREHRDDLARKLRASVGQGVAPRVIGQQVLQFLWWTGQVDHAEYTRRISQPERYTVEWLEAQPYTIRAAYIPCMTRAHARLT